MRCRHTRWVSHRASTTPCLRSRACSVIAVFGTLTVVALRSRARSRADARGGAARAAGCGRRGARPAGAAAGHRLRSAMRRSRPGARRRRGGIGADAAQRHAGDGGAGVAGQASPRGSCVRAVARRSVVSGAITRERQGSDDATAAHRSTAGDARAASSRPDGRRMRWAGCSGQRSLARARGREGRESRGWERWHES